MQYIPGSSELADECPIFVLNKAPEMNMTHVSRSKILQYQPRLKKPL